MVNPVTWIMMVGLPGKSSKPSRPSSSGVSMFNLGEMSILSDIRFNCDHRSSRNASIHLHSFDVLVWAAWEYITCMFFFFSPEVPKHCRNSAHFYVIKKDFWLEIPFSFFWWQRHKPCHYLTWDSAVDEGRLHWVSYPPVSTVSLNFLFPHPI